MSVAAWCLNTAWMLKCRAEGAAFDRASRCVAETQTRLLREILRSNRDTDFGHSHCFAKLADVRDFQQRVSLSTYEDFAPAIRRIAEGESNVLTSEPVSLLEPTSGTTGGEKMIPYTAGLRRQFRRGVAAWIADLFRRRPAVRRGRAYWSISPKLGPSRRSSGGLPIGFEDDAAYLGWSERAIIQYLLASPAAVAGLPDIETWRYATLLSLLAASDLALISVWSPTFLTALLTPLDAWQDRLCNDLRLGAFNPPAGTKPGWSSWLWPSPARADRVARLLRERASERLPFLWPQLAVISCWTDAASAAFVPGVRELFPGVEIQSKGLLATEGFVSFPLADRPGAALAVRCHFFEFQDDGGRCRLAHELDRGGRYRVVLTTAGGLYRYRLGDEVEVVGFYKRCPLLRFMGRPDAVSDLVGEKLAEPHIRAVLERIPAVVDIRPRFAMLVPVVGRLPGYRLYLQESGLAVDSPRVKPLRDMLEKGLQENPYYRQAVLAGQLSPVEVVVLDPAGESAWSLYERRCLAEGRKCGNIKPAGLDRRSSWPDVFAPLAAAEPTDHKSTVCRPKPG